MNKNINLAALALVSLSACGPKEKEVRIAAALPLTGDIAALGHGIRRASVMAVEEAVAAGRFPDFKLRVVEFDDRSDPKEAVNVANRIVSDPAVIAVMGHFNSGCSIPASAVYAQNSLPMVNPGSSNPELTRQQLSEKWRWPRNIFRANPTDDVQGTFAAEFVHKDLKLKKAAVIHDKTAYGQGLAEEFRKHFEALGGKAVSFDGAQVGEKDFKALLTRVKALGPDVLYFGGEFSVGGHIVRQAREAGLKVPFITGEINHDPEFLRIAGPAAEGAYVTFLGSPPELLPSAAQFIERYKARYPGEEVKAYDHYGYEVTNMLLEALEKVGPDKLKIMDYLRNIRYTGVLGETSFDEKGDTLNKTITLFRVKDGRFVPYGKEPAKA
ncbi:MAG: branched-chain amino acid ABC transporter substrate-binding protein [Elusimicrobiota bacterium]